MWGLWNLVLRGGNVLIFAHVLVTGGNVDLGKKLSLSGIFVIFFWGCCFCICGCWVAGFWI